VVESRADLAARYAAVQEEHADEEVPVPGHWGGYRVEPGSLEFWQGRPGRMHDRLEYRREGDRWRVVRLAP
jgi:pyridoxamine 5'-phosphate oxidase